MNIVYLHAHDAGCYVQPYGLPGCQGWLFDDYGKIWPQPV